LSYGTAIFDVCSHNQQKILHCSTREEIEKTKGNGHTGRMDVDEGLPNRILNNAPKGRRK
jgi:hypothetical protein